MLETSVKRRSDSSAHSEKADEEAEAEADNTSSSKAGLDPGDAADAGVDSLVVPGEVTAQGAYDDEDVNSIVRTYSESEDGISARILALEARALESRAKMDDLERAIAEQKAMRPGPSPPAAVGAPNDRNKLKPPTKGADIDRTLPSLPPLALSVAR